MKYFVKMVDIQGRWYEDTYNTLDEAFAGGRKNFTEIGPFVFALVEDGDWNARAVVVPALKGGCAIIPALPNDIYVEKLWGSETIYEERTAGEKLKDEVLMRAKKNPDVEFAMIFNGSDDYFEGFRKTSKRDAARLVYIEI